VIIIVVGWNDDLLVGVEIIDNQHKELFNRIDKLFEAMKSGKGKVEIINTLKFLEEYVVIHFYSEEDYMKKINYSGFNLQHAQHELFKKDIIELKETIEAKGASITLLFDSQKKINAWLRNHIMVLDKQIPKV
jgi:hemerythrin